MVNYTRSRLVNKYIKNSRSLWSKFEKVDQILSNRRSVCTLLAKKQIIKQNVAKSTKKLQKTFSTKFENFR